MLLWLKKLLYTRWFVSYDCEQCVNHYCGGCGRGVQEGNWFYTKRAAMADAKKWVVSSIFELENLEPGYELIETEIEGHTTIVCHYKIDGQEGDCEIFASVDPRTYW